MAESGLSWIEKIKYSILQALISKLKYFLFLLPAGLFPAVFPVSGQSLADSVIRSFPSASGEEAKLSRSAELINTAFSLLEEGFGEEAKELVYEALEQVKSLNASDALASLMSMAGDFFSVSSNYSEAIRLFRMETGVLDQTGNITSKGIALYNLGNSYYLSTDYPKALESYQEALAIFQENGSSRGIAAANDGLGLVYEMLTEFEKAMSHYGTSIAIYQERGDSLRLAETYNNYAVLLTRQASIALEQKFGRFWEDSCRIARHKPEAERFKSAIAYLDLAIPLHKELNNLQGLGSALSTLAKIHKYMGNYERAIAGYEEALRINQELNDRVEQAVNLNNLASCYSKTGDRKKAEALYRSSLELAFEQAHTELKMYNFLSLSELEETSGNYPDAFEYYRLYAEEKDSFLNQSKLEAIKDAEVKYETREKERRIDALNRENELKAARFRLLVAGTVLISLFLGLTIRLYTRTRTQNHKISSQKEQIEFQKHEIDKSIQAAKIIQQAALPGAEILQKIIPGHFIFFRPVAEVSGDFYWICQEHNKTYVWTADCTGHGIPGAFVSMMGIAIIRETISANPESDAAGILDKVREEMIRSMQQSGRIGEGKHGMDVSFYILDAERKKLDYAGANNPLLISRKQELLVYKADKMPIGPHEKSSMPFTNHSIELQRGDVLFTYSDGFQDQFGGLKGKKYMSTNFRDYLHSISSLAIDEMHEKLREEYVHWKGDLEQVDDVLVIAVRV